MSTGGIVAVIALIVLTGIGFAAAAFFDRRRAREIERDLAKPPPPPDISHLKR